MRNIPGHADVLLDLAWSEKVGRRYLHISPDEYNSECAFLRCGTVLHINTEAVQYLHISPFILLIGWKTGDNKVWPEVTLIQRNQGSTATAAASVASSLLPLLFRSAVAAAAGLKACIKVIQRGGVEKHVLSIISEAEMSAAPTAGGAAVRGRGPLRQQ